MGDKLTNETTLDIPREFINIEIKLIVATKLPFSSNLKRDCEREAKAVWKSENQKRVIDPHNTSHRPIQRTRRHFLLNKIGSTISMG